MKTPTYNPGPDFFRELAIEFSIAEPTFHRGNPLTRGWIEDALGVKPGCGLFGFGEYRKPNRARVICALWLELLSAEQAAK